MTAEEQWWTITAYHEAGHVVAALVCGFPFEYVTIEPYEKGMAEGWTDKENNAEAEMGHVKLTDDPLTTNGIDLNGDRLLSVTDVRLIHRVMVQRLAGYYAVRLITQDPKGEPYGARQDLGIANALANFLAKQPSSRSDRSYFGEAVACASELMSIGKDMVDTIACALLRAGTLTQAQTLATLQESSIAQARAYFLMAESEDYRSVEDAAFLDKWLIENPEA